LSNKKINTMQNDKELNANQSLEIINAMINTAKNRLADDGFFFILWGWLVFSASIIHYYCLKANIQNGYIGWTILMPLGAIVSIIYGRKNSKKESATSYVHSYLAYLWSAFLAALIITLAFMPIHGVKSTYFFLMLLYGLATLVSGGMLAFRPLIIGSLFSFILAIASTFADINEQTIFIAGSIFCSYIVPGHLLKSKYKSQVNV